MEESEYKAEHRKIKLKQRQLTTKLRGYMIQDAPLQVSTLFDNLMKSVDAACFEVTDKIDELIMDLEESEGDNDARISDLVEMKEQVLKALKDSKDELVLKRYKKSSATESQDDIQNKNHEDEDIVKAVGVDNSPCAAAQTMDDAPAVLQRSSSQIVQVKQSNISTNILHTGSDKMRRSLGSMSMNFDQGPVLEGSKEVGSRVKGLCSVFESVKAEQSQIVDQNIPDIGTTVKNTKSKENPVQTIDEMTKKAVSEEDGEQSIQHCTFSTKPLLVEYVVNTAGQFHPSCSPLQREIHDKQCNICQKVLMGESSILNDSEGNYYHPSCSKCRACQTPIKGSFVKDSLGNLVHPDCRRCERCGSLFTGILACSAHGNCQVWLKLLNGIYN